MFHTKPKAVFNFSKHTVFMIACCAVLLVSDPGHYENDDLLYWLFGYTGDPTFVMA